MNEIVTSVNNCARCGGNHALVKFTRFVRPPADATHWGQCQKTGDPILMVLRVVETLVPADSMKMPHVE
jgi:hypothetical protein